MIQITFSKLKTTYISLINILSHEEDSAITSFYPFKYNIGQDLHIHGHPAFTSAMATLSGSFFIVKRSPDFLQPGDH